MERVIRDLVWIIELFFIFDRRYVLLLIVLVFLYFVVESCVVD